MNGVHQPGMLLAATLWWPLSARLATRLIEHGCRVSAVCPSGHVIRHVKGLNAVYRYGAFDPRAALEAAIEAERPQVIVPCDDRVVWQLHEIHARRPHLRPLIETSLGAAEAYPIVAHRERLLETAEDLGVRVPETRHLGGIDGVRAWFRDGATRAVLKRDGTWGGDGVQIARSEGEAVAAYQRLASRPQISTPAKRYLVNRDPLAWWAWRSRAGAAMTIQSFIEGRPANAMLACWRGEVLGIVSVEVLVSQGQTGAGVVVRLIRNEEIETASRKLAARLSLTGFYGLDFMIERGTGHAYLIEMNPRCTQLGHLVLPGQGDLAGLLAAKLRGTSGNDEQSGVGAEAPPIMNDVIAFFPQALVSHPRGGFVQGAHLDVPWEHPELIHELMQPSFPDRQWPARVYHFFHAPRRVSAVEFQPSALSRTEITTGQGTGTAPGTATGVSRVVV